MDCSSITDFQQSTAIRIAKKFRNLHIGIQRKFLVYFLYYTLPALSYFVFALFFRLFILGCLKAFQLVVLILLLNALLRCSEIVSLSLSLTSSRSASFACHKT